jgi:hypothetical protein
VSPRGAVDAFRLTLGLTSPLPSTRPTELAVLPFHFVTPHRHSIDRFKDNIRTDRFWPLKGRVAVFANQDYLEVILPDAELAMNGTFYPDFGYHD